LRTAAARAGIALREMGKEVGAELNAAVSDLRQAARSVGAPPSDAPPGSGAGPSEAGDGRSGASTARENSSEATASERPAGPEAGASAPGASLRPPPSGAESWPAGSATGLEPNLAAALSYVGWAMTGILFFYVFEPRDRFVRFHALQSILLTAALMVVGVAVSAVPLIGPFLFRVAALGFVLAWLLVIWKALHHELYPLPFIGEIARGQVDRRAG
jgi:uncharacterized membrane protein